MVTTTRTLEALAWGFGIGASGFPNPRWGADREPPIRVMWTAAAFVRITAC